MSRFITGVFGALCVLLFSFPALADQQARLLIPWPPGWEYQPPSLVNGVWYMQARRASNASEWLQLTIVKAPENSEPIKNESIRSLVADLAALSKSDVRAFPAGAGYYFIAPHHTPSNDTRHFAEGMLLRDGYLIRMTLYAGNLASDESAGILAAIANAKFNTTAARN